MRFVLFTVVLLSCSVAHANEKAVKAATIAARQWLALVDAGNYAASWDQAAGLFKNGVTKESWKTQVGAVRKPLGPVVSRRLSAAKYTTSAPGAPDGEYVVIQFATSFRNKKAAVETITPMLDQDKKWRVAGYFIK